MYTANIQSLIDATYDYLSSFDTPHLASFLEKWPAKPFTTRQLRPRSLPVVSYLTALDVEEDSKGSKLIELLQLCAETLSWRRTYSAEDFGADFLQNYGWTILIGPRGQVASDHIMCGYLMLGPHTEYPKHSHEAEEIYVPLTSQTLWVRGNGDWVSRPSNDPIYYSPWMVHGMRTGSVPLVTLVVWQNGDSTKKSHIHS